MPEFVYPEQMEWLEASASYGRLAVEPFERGYATTLGNALRRVLLSSIPGAAVVRVNFAGRYHEYDTLPGVREDLLAVILNLKALAIRSTDGEPHRLSLDIQGPGDVRAEHIETPTGVSIVNPELHLASLSDDGRLEMEMEIEVDRGFRSADENKREDAPLSLIPVDCDFSPVERVNYLVEDTRVGGLSGYERLVLEVFTDGSVSPQEAVEQAVATLGRHFEFLAGGVSRAAPVEEETPEENLLVLADMGLDVRACNLLREEGIVTMGDLLARSREELLDIHGLGEKTLQRLLDKLAELGYALRSEKES